MIGGYNIVQFDCHPMGAQLRRVSLCIHQKATAFCVIFSTAMDKDKQTEDKKKEEFDVLEEDDEFEEFETDSIRSLRVALHHGFVVNCLLFAGTLCRCRCHHPE